MKNLKAIALRQLVFYCAFILIFYQIPLTSFGQSNWENLAPGAGGQVQDLYFDPHVENRIWLSSDQEGSYVSDDLGQSWDFIGRDFSHGMSFIIRKSNNPNGRIYQGGLWGAHYSDNGGTNWTRIETTKADAIAAIAISPDDSTVVLAPSWHTKDPQKIQASISDPIQELTGERYVYISTDGGNTFTKSVYEPIDGYDHVYEVFIHPTTGIIYLGAASGVYYSNNSQGSSWTRVDNPTDAYLGVDGGITTFTLFKSDGITIDPNGYKFSGGCTGIGFSPSGDRIYAVFQTAEREWAIYSTQTTSLSSSNPGWTKINNNLPVEPQWHIPVIDPRSSSTEHKILLGTTFLGSNNRVGLYEGTITLDGSNNITNNNWQQIIKKPDGNTFTFEEGWETASLISRAYNYTPTSWSNRLIITAGGNNYFLSTDPAAPGWPGNPDSWLPIYTNVSSQNFGPEHTYFSTGFTNTVSYDIDTYENYAVQGNADQGTLESWDFGLSWTKNTVPRGITNSQSVAISNTNPPLVLIDSRPGFGIASKTIGRLYARELTNLNLQPEADDWKLIGGGSDKSNIVNGLPNRQIQGIALDNFHPSRVYVGLRTEFGVGGIYSTEELESIFDGDANWVEISTASMSTEPQFNDIHIDPNNSNVIWAAGNNLYKGTRTAPYTWQWEEMNLTIDDMYVWDDNGNTRVAVAGTVSGNYEVYLIDNPDSTGWNSTGRFIPTGLTIEETLNLRPQVWVEPDETITFGLMAGYSNQIFIGTENTQHKKGLGVFKGTIAANGTVTWEDFTGDDQNMDFIYSRDNSADSKIIRESNGDINYYIPTFGTGVWRRNIDTNAPDQSFKVETSSLRFGKEANESKNFGIASNSGWTISNIPSWITASQSSGTGNDTITLTVNSPNIDIAKRTATIEITSNGRSIEVLITQEGTPIPIDYLNSEILIDGLQDDHWDSLDWYDITENVFGTTTDSQDRFKIAYDRQGLYILVRVQDSTPNNYLQGDTLYLGDDIVVGIDIGNDKNSIITSSDFLFRVRNDGFVEALGESESLGVTTSVNNISAGYVYELFIDWNDLGTVPTNQAELGFEISVSDNQTGTNVDQVNQWFTSININTSNPFQWGNTVLTGPDIPWFEEFSLPVNTLEDSGTTAWSIDLSQASLADANDYFKVIEGGVVEARDLDGEAVLTTEFIDISQATDLKVSVLAKEKGDNFREENSNYIKLFVKIDDGEEILVDQLVGDAEVDDEFIILQKDGLSGDSLQVIVKVANDRGGTFHTIDNLLVDFGSPEVCSEPQDLQITSLTSESVFLEWTVPQQGLSTFEVQIKEQNDSIWTSEIVQYETETNIVDLNSDQQYNWRVRQTCITSNSDWVDGNDFKTLLPVNLVTIYRETFDKDSCSSSFDDVVNYECYVDSIVNYSGTAFIDDKFNNGTYENASNLNHVFLGDSLQDFSISGLNTTGYTNLILQFGIQKNGNNQDGSDLGVFISSIDTGFNAIPISLPTGDSTSSFWYQLTLDSPDLIENDSLTIIFQALGGSKYRIDDIEILGESTQSVTCDNPQELISSGIGFNSVNLSWAQISTATQGYEIRVFESGSSQYLLDTMLTEENISIDGLTQNTTYTWEVRSNCSANTQSSWVSSNFTTLANQEQDLFKETFDQQSCSSSSSDVANYTCYSESNATHSGTAVINDNLNNGTYSGATNGNHVFLNFQGATYQIEDIDLTGNTNLQLNFGIRKNGKNEDGSNLSLEITSDGTNWQTLSVTLPTGDGTNDQWYLIEVPISLAASSDFGVRFTTLGSPKFRLDDISFTGTLNLSSRLLNTEDDLEEELSVDIDRLKVYPNGFNDQLNILIPNDMNVDQIVIYDLTGRMYFKSSGNSTEKIQINTSNWKNQLYLLQLTDQKGELSHIKLIKSN
ncbi:sugar-binding protein [Marinigracilibium pacificum]|uniref:T9SS type A sorting domain-containing protein n=1 Tax=Marinigracilibium pacificum TaxID=2729599 RepID=A0A848IXJ6_9BACT|nr:sugar-binding protein [Marinigracilibium pacificum]NMM48366.1 T9SS type A sorting domain-containing protein [Marinigracilibium pacificum]